MARYRYPILDSRRMEWQSSQDQALAITLSLVQEEWSLDEERTWASHGAPRVRIVVTVDGHEQGHRQCVEPVTGQSGIVGQIGRVGLSTDRLAQYEAMQRELAQHPEMVAAQERRVVSGQVDQQYRDHVRAVERAMTLDGDTY